MPKYDEVSIPCRNTSCASYGKTHPNCRCYNVPIYASEGGQICSGPHMEGCEHFADGGKIAENEKFHNDPVDALDHSAIQHGLLGLLTKTGHSKSENEHKSSLDHHASVKHGKKLFHNHMENLFVDHKMEPHKESREALKKHIDHLNENPEEMLNIGGNLGDVFPDHAIQLAAKAGTAVNYLTSLKPTKPVNRPLDRVPSHDRVAEGHYNRQIDIAQQPLMILQHFKKGTLRPDDIQTLQTIYPGLHKEIMEKGFEQLVNAKEKNMEIPYKQKMSLSLLLGQPLDSTMTPEGMQAIIRSQGGQQMPQQAAHQSKEKSNKSTGVELSQINKVNELDYTQLQDHQADKLKD